jgi:type IX secretion system PorP/SprF family membrane protein
MKRRLYILLNFLILTTFYTYGQDAHYSQFYANPIYLNPAFAGTVNCPRISINFRDQWPAFKNNFLSFSASYDQHISELHGGVGVLATGDILGGGIFQSYSAGAIYNFRIQAAYQFYLQFALQANYLYSSLNWSKLEFASELIPPHSAPSDFPIELDNNLKKSQFDANFGFVGYTPFLYFGFAMHHLLPLQKNYLGISKNKTEWEPKFTAHLGGKITIVQKMKDENNFGDIYLHPNVIFMSQGAFHYLHEGFYFNFYPFTIGAWLRHNCKNLDAFIVSCGVEYRLIRIGYSYDFNLTKLERTGGAHEVSLQFIIPCDPDRTSKSLKKARAKMAPMDCPLF